MQISSYLPVLATIIPFVVEFVKTSPQIQSITPETKGRLMALAAVLSSSAGVLSGFADGSIDGNAASMFIDASWQAAVAFGLTQGVYNFLKWAGFFKKSE